MVAWLESKAPMVGNSPEQGLVVVGYETGTGRPKLAPAEQDGWEDAPNVKITPSNNGQ